MKLKFKRKRKTYCRLSDFNEELKSKFTDKIIDGLEDEFCYYEIQGRFMYGVGRSLQPLQKMGLEEKIT